MWCTALWCRNCRIHRYVAAPKIQYTEVKKKTLWPCCSLLESLDECTDLPEGELAYESLTIVHKVLAILRDWTRGDGLTDDQVDAVDAYYTSLKDCDYLGMSLKGQCHKIFGFRFFSWISFSQASEYPTRAV
jgi:hypothetical protein